MSTPATAYCFDPSGGMPNNALPLLLWRARLDGESIEGSKVCGLYERNGWFGTWIYTVYPFWHFHTLGHEVLTCITGRARIGFGGEDGFVGEIEPGDVCVIPAGVGHKRLESSKDFQMAGAYPPDQQGDIVRAGAMNLDLALAAVAKVRSPKTDPITGHADGVVAAWRAAPLRSK